MTDRSSAFLGSASSAVGARELKLDVAYDLAGSLGQSVTFDNGTTKIISGSHVDFGRIHLIFPAFGEAVLLTS